MKTVWVVVPGLVWLLMLASWLARPNGRVPRALASDSGFR